MQTQLGPVAGRNEGNVMKRAAIIIGAAALPAILYFVALTVSRKTGVHPFIVLMLMTAGIGLAALAMDLTESDE